jgi:inner membrane protein
MSPVTHFLASWALANLAASRRDRIIITIAGVAPDLDGLGAPVELLTRNSGHPHLWFSEYHHVLGHTLLAAVCISVMAALFSKRRAVCAALAFAAVHLHFFCDVVGSRGPEGFNWTIPYLWPFSNAGVWQWSGQWQLNGWQNVLITLLLIAFALWAAINRGFSPVEVFSLRGDGKFVAVVRQRLLHSAA